MEFININKAQNNNKTKCNSNKDIVIRPSKTLIDQRFSNSQQEREYNDHKIDKFETSNSTIVEKNLYKDRYNE